MSFHVSAVFCDQVRTPESCPRTHPHSSNRERHISVFCKYLSFSGTFTNVNVCMNGCVWERGHVDLGNRFMHYLLLYIYSLTHYTYPCLNRSERSSLYKHTETLKTMIITQSKLQKQYEQTVHALLYNLLCIVWAIHKGTISEYIITRWWTLKPLRFTECLCLFTCNRILSMISRFFCEAH